jgi:EAL domain-containing protein (putative c-di-GMP-specific phosphodiesterase class I)
VLQVGNGRPTRRPSGPTTAAQPVSAPVAGRLPNPDEFHTVFQPVVSLRTGDVVGFEALTRFDDGTSPERWLSDAAAAGTSMALEALLVRAALRASTSLPNDVWLAVKASPRVIEADQGIRNLLGAAGRQLVVEVTEPSTSDMPSELRRLPALLPSNVALAIEHAGVGHKSISALMDLAPRYVKLDRSVIVGLAGDRARQAQVAAFVRVAGERGCLVVASGVENEEDRQAASDLGASLGQGYLLGRPEELVGV